MDNFVRVFQSTDTGAPVLSGTAGTLIAVLDACLTAGYGTVTIDSLVVASNVATVTDSSGHGFTAIGTVGPVIRIAGATPAGLNGDWRITYVSATQFTFATTGISDQTASGTITAKRAPAGFTKAFSGTNLAAYRSDDVTGTRLYLRVDAGNQYARIRGYEEMTDVSTGTGLFPTEAQISGGGFAICSNVTDTTPRPWVLFADSRLIYLFCDYNNSNGTWAGGFVFGDFNSYVSSDIYGCMILYSPFATALQLSKLGETTASCIARSYTKTGTSILSARYTHGKMSALGYGGQAYPALSDSSTHFWPVECWETTVVGRGMMPGLWCPLHNSEPPHGTVVSDIPQLSGRTLLVQCTGSVAYRAAFDITGPWR